jgi:D-amino-acid oxidase
MNCRPVPANVAVLGGGVTGITTAVMLQLRGISTTLYAKDLPFYSLQSAPAQEFATPHAAASVLPHSVRSAQLPSWTCTSLDFFGALAFRAEAGVRLQKHYEMFERASVGEPPYADFLDNFEILTRREISQGRVPVRTSASALSGWRFDVYFCEARTYLRYLYRLFEAIGGTIVSSIQMDLDDHLVGYLRFGHSLYINCTGLGTSKLLDLQQLDAVEDLPDGAWFEPLLDPWEPRIERGHYITVRCPGALVDHDGARFSYNYTPTADVYESHDTEPADVYCYPRSDTWVLGGSRQLRQPTGSTEVWRGDPTPQGMDSFLQADGVRVSIPRPIFELNASLIERLTEGRVSLHRIRRDSPAAFAAGVGYRFQRSCPNESIRLSTSRIRLAGREQAVIHNYGHGGAGFTLSWGCAMQVAREVGQLVRAGWPAPLTSNAEVSEEFKTTANILVTLSEKIYATDPRLVV